MPKRLPLSPRALAERVIAQQVRRDLKRGLTTGSKDYQQAMREAEALFKLAETIDEELGASRRTWDGMLIFRPDGSSRTRPQPGPMRRSA